jgi:hypothetical protein
VMLRFGLVTKVGLAAIALLLFAMAAAVTSTNALPATRAGDGTGTISGYTISNVQYTLNATTPQNVDSVSVTLTTTPTTGSTKKLGLAGSSGSTTWYTCSNSGATLTCPTTSPQATAWGVTQGGLAASGTTSASGTLTLVITD